MPHQAVRTSPLRLLALELCLCLGIVVLCTGACLREVPRLLHKVNMMGPMLGMAPTREARVEALALTGRLDADSGVMVEGRVRPGGTPYRLSLNPVLLNDGMDAHVIWLCGQRRAPAAWSGPVRPVVDGLAVHQLPAACRGAIE